MRTLDRDALRAWMAVELQIPLDLPDDEPLFSTGRLDSFALVDLLGWIEARTGVVFDDRDIRLENVDSPGLLIGFVRRRSGMEEARRYVEERQRVLDGVRRVLVEATRLPQAPEDIDPDTPLFGTGLALDSIDALELVIAIEHAFDVTLADEDGPALALRTVDTVVDRVLDRRRAR